MQQTETPCPAEEWEFILVVGKPAAVNGLRDYAAGQRSVAATKVDDASPQTKGMRRSRKPAQFNEEPSPLVDIKDEFDRFVAAMVPVVPLEGQRRGHRGVSEGIRTSGKPSISTEAIYERGLVILDAEGARALTVRRLAEELKISTRTLYTRIGKRNNLIRNVVALHFAKLDPDFRDGASWEATVWNWCSGLRESLCAHPHLTDLMTNENVLVLGHHVDALVDVTVQEGIAPSIAVDCCRALANVTINHAIREVRAMRDSGCSPQATVRHLEESTADVKRTIGWILAAVRAE